MTNLTRKNKNPSIILASKCRENKILSRTIKQTIKKKFKSQDNLKVSVIVTAKMVIEINLAQYYSVMLLNFVKKINLVSILTILRLNI